MRLFLFLLFANLTVNGMECPEGTSPHTIYNNCQPTEFRICALWYSRVICVRNPKICTMDINSWGYASSCLCDQGFTYNSSIGQCLPHQEISCTRDINSWGFPSHCSCQDGMRYEEVSGICLD